MRTGAVQCGRFSFDPDQRRVCRDGVPVHLTPKAFDLIQVLLAEAPRVVTKAELHERLWPGTFVSDSSLAGLIKELRRVLDDDDATAPLIRTVHRIGYAWTLPADPVRPTAPVCHWLVLNSERVMLQQRQNVIGRDPASDVWLDIPGISRRHARIVIEGDLVTLEDLGSKNGTAVGEAPVQGPVALHDGDRVRFGPVESVYRKSDSGVSTQTREPA